jgi:Ca2+-binding EF-hand superfamily protein
MEEVFTPEQLFAFKRSFDLFDASNEGLIPFDKLQVLLRSIGQKPTTEDILAYKNEFDADNRGYLNFDAFKDIMTERFRKDDKATAILAAFKIFDKENSGNVKCDDLRDAILSLSDLLNDEQVDEMMKDLDPEATGAFNYVDLVKEMMEVKALAKPDA